jgi:hypothetical protein
MLHPSSELFSKQLCIFILMYVFMTVYKSLSHPHEIILFMFSAASLQNQYLGSHSKTYLNLYRFLLKNIFL